MNVKIINKSSREVPEELLDSMIAEEGFDKYQIILEQYNLKFGEIDLHLAENQITVIVIDKRGEDFR